LRERVSDKKPFLDWRCLSGLAIPLRIDTIHSRQTRRKYQGSKASMRVLSCIFPPLFNKYVAVQHGP
jgi:hypothetical protein